MSRPARRHSEEHGNDERWLVTYADMITLLMAFFIMMYAMSIVNLGKFNELAVSVRSGFGGDAQGRRSSTVGFDSPVGVMPLALPRNAFGLMRRISEVVKAPLSKSERKNIQFVSEDGVVKMRIKADDVLFARGSADINPSALHTLRAIGQAIRAMPYDVRIEGHTCNLPVRAGRFASNWELSAQRAINVVTFLIRDSEISPRRLSAVGYADTAPVVPNFSEENRARNRRIDVVLIRPLTASKGRKRPSATARPVPPSISPKPVELVPRGNQSLGDETSEVPSE